MSSEETPSTGTGWDKVNLGSVSSILTGHPFKSDVFTESPAEGDLPLVRIRDVPAGRSSTYVTGPIDDAIRSRYLVQDDDVLIGMDGRFHISQWRGGEALLNQRVAKIVFDDAEVNPAFGYYSLFSPIRLVEAGKHYTTVKHLSMGDLRSLEIDLPPLPEQRAIAHILRTVQRAKEVTEQIIAAAQELKTSLMRHMFTYGPKSNTEEVSSLVDSEFGAIPAHWGTSPLSDCAVIQSGATKGRRIESDEAIEVPYLRVANVQDGFLDLREVKTITIKASELGRFALRTGDILLTEGGDFDKLGRGHIWRGQIDPCVHQNHIFVVRPDSDRALPEFASYLMQNPYAKRYFLKVAHRTTNLASINKAKLGRFPMLLPPIEEQEQVVRSLAIVDHKIAAEDARLDALRTLFDSLLHDLMTGRRRVTDLKIPA